MAYLKRELGNETTNRGKGLWKFNNYLFHETNQINVLKILLNTGKLNTLVDR